MQIISQSKQKPITSTGTEVTPYVYTLEATGSYDEIKWLERHIQLALNMKVCRE
jgi:hypothetical protein